MSDAIIDACCLINFYASGDIGGILAASNLSCHITSLAASESAFIRVRDENGEARLERIALDQTIASGVLKVCGIEGKAEADLYVRLAADLDDGEAMALAIAKHRGWLLVTDDRKAKHISDLVEVPVVTTPELMRRWAETGNVEPSRVSAVLRNIESGARFSPRTDSPDGEWWQECRG